MNMDFLSNFSIHFCSFSFQKIKNKGFKTVKHYIVACGAIFLLHTTVSHKILVALGFELLRDSFFMEFFRTLVPVLFFEVFFIANTLMIIVRKGMKAIQYCIARL
jgi:hypothetical protein